MDRIIKINRDYVAEVLNLTEDSEEMFMQLAEKMNKVAQQIRLRRQVYEAGLKKIEGDQSQIQDSFDFDETTTTINRPLTSTPIQNKGPKASSQAAAVKLGNDTTNATAPYLIYASELNSETTFEPETIQNGQGCNCSHTVDDGTRNCRLFRCPHCEKRIKFCIFALADYRSSSLDC